MKTSRVITLSRLMANARMTKMTDDNKLKVLRLARAIKPVCTDFDEAQKDAAARLKPEGYDDRRMHGAELTEEDVAFHRNMEVYMGELLGKDVKLGCEPLGKDAVEQLELSNDYTIGDMSVLEDCLADMEKG